MKILNLDSTWKFFQTKVVFGLDRSHYTKRVYCSTEQTQCFIKVCLGLDTLLGLLELGKQQDGGAGLMVGFDDNKGLFQAK